MWAYLTSSSLEFDLDMQHCPNCHAGELKIISAILELTVIEKILTNLGLDPQPSPPEGGRSRRGKVSQSEPRPEPRLPSETPSPWAATQDRSRGGDARRFGEHHRRQGQP